MAKQKKRLAKILPVGRYVVCAVVDKSGRVRLEYVEHYRPSDYKKLNDTAERAAGAEKKRLLFAALSTMADAKMLKHPREF